MDRLTSVVVVRERRPIFMNTHSTRDFMRAKKFDLIHDMHMCVIECSF